MYACRNIYIGECTYIYIHIMAACLIWPCVCARARKYEYTNLYIYIYMYLFMNLFVCVWILVWGGYD